MALYQKSKLPTKKLKFLVSSSPGCEVLFIDYGNKSIATDLRALPDHILRDYPYPCAIHCTLQAAHLRPDVHPISVDEFSSLSDEIFNRLCHFQLIEADSSPSVVRMFKDAQCEQEIVVTNATAVPKSTESQVDAACVELVQLTENVIPIEVQPLVDQSNPIVVSGLICWANSSSDFYVQPESRSADGKFIVEQLVGATEFSQATDLQIGDLCAAQFADDEIFYRAKVIVHNDNCKCLRF